MLFDAKILILRQTNFISHTHMNIFLKDDDNVRANLLPLTFTRPTSLLRIGILTIEEKWKRMLPGQYSYITAPYLATKYPKAECRTENDITIASHILPNETLAIAISQLKPGQRLSYQGEEIAHMGEPDTNPSANIDFPQKPDSIKNIYDIFRKNDVAIMADFDMLTSNRESQTLSDTNIVIGDRRKIFVEPGACVEGTTLNAKNGPIYIGRDAEIMEGSCIRGGLALLDGATVNMGTKIYGATTIGPHCKVGGELNNVVMIGYSNKAHDGFLGNAVIGEWCNIGAGCVASNLKNDYTEIKLWNYPSRRFLKTGLQFCGLIMGDHSKAGINTMFNTATVLGVGVNIHGSGFPRNFVASFTEGSPTGFSDVPMHKFIDIAKRVMARRNVELTDIDIDIIANLYEITDSYK